jgi:hypothetical protein
MLFLIDNTPLKDNVLGTGECKTKQLFPSWVNNLNIFPHTYEWWFWGLKMRSQYNDMKRQVSMPKPVNKLKV